MKPVVSSQGSVHPSSFVRHPLSLILLIFTLLTAYQSIVLPIGEAADETDHYQYHRFVARAGHPPLTAAERQEAGFKGGLAPLYYWLTAWPVALVGKDTLPDIRRVDSRPERHIPTDGLGINHVLHTLDEQWPWRGQPLAWHLVRFLSLPMGLVTIIATYALARRLFPKPKIIAIGAAAFVAFLPRFVISSAVINDDNLVFALTALLLLTQVIILQSQTPPSLKIMATFGALFGLALVTKYFSLILIPEVVLTLVVAGRRDAGGRRDSRIRHQASGNAQYAIRNTQYISRLMPLLFAFLFALFLTAGLWFIFIVARFNRIDDLGLIAGLAASLGEPQITEGLVGLLSGQSVRPVAATYPLAEWLSLLYRSFWFEYGWMRIFAPVWVYACFTIFSLLALAGLIQLTIKNYQLLINKYRSAVFRLLALHLFLFVFVVLARYVLSATIDTGQGRHLYPALPVIALLASVGLFHLQFTIYDSPVGLRLFRQIRPLLPAAFFLIPAAISLLPSCSSVAHHSSFISPHYHTHPATTAPTGYGLNLEFAPGLLLTGLEADSTATAGDAFPVTLYWHAKSEAAQDYLVSLCLQDNAQRPVACGRSHFEDGRYPARAWEAGDTLIDTLFIPIPVCYRIFNKPYTLSLTVWALDSAFAAPHPVEPAALHHQFSGPKITIRPTDSLRNYAQTVEMWLAGQRLTEASPVQTNQTLAQITYAGHNSNASSLYIKNVPPPAVWNPVQLSNTSLYLPCADGPEPFATLENFVADVTLPNGTYQPNVEAALPELTLLQRSRIFGPVSASLTFDSTLAPLSVEAQGQTIQMDAVHTAPGTGPVVQLADPTLPVTVRWQGRRRMAGPLVVALKLLDKDFAVGGERVSTLGNRYPSLLWAPTEIVNETYPLKINPDAPPGLYVLEMGVIWQDETLPDGYRHLPVLNGETAIGKNLYPLTVRRPDPAHKAPPPNPFQAQLGDTVRLTGYDVNLVQSDSPPAVTLALYWQSTGKTTADYTVFTQLIGPDGQVWAQWDNPPQAGRYPTSAWAKNDTVVDRYTLTLREGAPSGNYRLLVGMYIPATGKRLPATINGQPQPNSALELTIVSVNP